MDLVLSLGNVSPAERRRRLVAAADAIVSTLHARFPAAEGYVHVKEDRLAQWAWPGGTQKSEPQLMRELDPATVACAFRRGIRVTRGATWGLTMDFQTTDRSMGEARLMAMSESTLAVFLAVGGFIVGLVLAMSYAFATGHAEGRAIKAAMIGGFGAGAVLGGIGWLLSRPFEGLKAPQVKEILDAMAERARSALGS